MGITFLWDGGWVVQRFLNLPDQTLFCGRGTLWRCSSHTVWKILSEKIPVGPLCCGLILTPRLHWEKKARLLLHFPLGCCQRDYPPLTSKSSVSVSHLSHICVTLLCLLGLIMLLDCWSTSFATFLWFCLLLATLGTCVSELICLIPFCCSSAASDFTGILSEPFY